MDFIYQDPQDIKQDEYLDIVSRRTPVGFTTEMGAYAGQGMEWMPTVRFTEAITELGLGFDTEATLADPNIELEKRRQEKLSKELSKEEFYDQLGEKRKTLQQSWYEGITQLKTDALIRRHDERRFREFIFQHSPGGVWRKASGIGLMFAMNATDPTNYIPIFGYGSEVNALGKLVGFGKLLSKHPGWGAVAVNAADAAMGATLADFYIINRLHAEGENTPWSELVWDAVMSVGASSILTGLAVGFSKVRNGQTPIMDIPEDGVVGSRIEIGEPETPDIRLAQEGDRLFSPDGPDYILKEGEMGISWLQSPKGAFRRAIRPLLERLMQDESIHTVYFESTSGASIRLVERLGAQTDELTGMQYLTREQIMEKVPQREIDKIRKSLEERKIRIDKEAIDRELRENFPEVTNEEVQRTRDRLIERYEDETDLLLRDMEDQLKGIEEPTTEDLTAGTREDTTVSQHIEDLEGVEKEWAEILRRRDKKELDPDSARIVNEAETAVKRAEKQSEAIEDLLNCLT